MKIWMLVLCLGLTAGGCNPRRSGQSGGGDEAGDGGNEGPSGGDGSSDGSGGGGGTSTQPGNNLPDGGADPTTLTGPQTRTIGRVGKLSDGSYRLAYPGTGAQISFTGPQITIGMTPVLPGQANAVNVYLDNTLASTVFLRPTNGASNRYPIDAPGDTKRVRTLTVVKRNEVIFGEVLLQGFETTGTLNPNTLARPARLIEFIGDNVVVGYGADGPTASPTAPACSGSGTQWATNPQLANADAAYPILVAKALRADWSVVGASGRGIATNYSGTTGNTLPALWRLADPQDIRGGRHDFGAAPQPNVVVLHGGGSDVSFYTRSNGAMDKGAFIAAYKAFLADIRSAYPKALIVGVIGPNLGGAGLALAREVVQAGVAAAADSRVTFLELTANSTDVSCDYHPDKNGHQKIAAQLGPVIAQAAGWGS